MNSADIRKARDGLIDYVNNIPFPTEVKRYIIGEVKALVDATANKEIQIQLQKEKKEVKLNDESV